MILTKGIATNAIQVTHLQDWQGFVPQVPHPQILHEKVGTVAKRQLTKGMTRGSGMKKGKRSMLRKAPRIKSRGGR